MSLARALDPRSIAIVGASDNPHKVGGRPILYLKRYGFRGAIYPVNPARAEVQGLRAYPEVAALPEAPDLAIVAVAGEEAVRAVEACAKRGVGVCVVMASGFGETGEKGKETEETMSRTSRAAGMRLVGPNCQGLANFRTGAVANFSTVFNEMEGRDGPVAIVGQSGACSQAIYILARQRGLDVRHVHATGNEADVTVAELAAEIVREDGIRLVLLYMEEILKPDILAGAAQSARERDVPIVAVKAGRTDSGRRAAGSHTGALASEDRVVDAFFERHAIWRAADPYALVSAGPLYLKGWRPRQARLIFLSNSGASCVMAADAMEEMGLPAAALSEQSKSILSKILPPFATISNPLDVTGALLTDSSLFGRILPVLADDPGTDLLLGAIPVAGAGYDVPRFARDFAAYAQATGRATAMAAPQPEVRTEFERAGVPAFEREREAVRALRQLASHAALGRQRVTRRAVDEMQFPPGTGRYLHEQQSLALLRRAGIATVESVLCRTEDEARAAFGRFGAPVAVKGCSRDLPHKSEHGLVRLGIVGEGAAANAFRSLREKIESLQKSFDGVVVARMVSGLKELALGARLDAQFGPVVMLGDGGVNLEALDDIQLLLPPFDEDEAVERLKRLRIAPLLWGVRGQPPLDVYAFARMAVRLGDGMLGWRGAVAAVDVNPVMLFEAGRGALAVDALIERTL